MQNKANLRKGHMNISVFTIKDYKNGPAFGVPESKPNQSQFVFLAGENAELAGVLLSKGRCECDLFLRQ